MKSLRWLGPILDLSGYASAARGYLRAASAAGLVIQPRDRSRSINLQGRGMDDGVMSMYQTLYKNQVPPDSPTVQHQVPDALYEDKKSSYPVAYTIFEMASVPKTWVAPCNRMRAIWTGSSYSKAAFMTSGVKVPIHVLPHAIDVKAYSPEAKPWAISNRRGFAFLSVMDFTERKAWRDLLRAYWHAFKRKDDVCLILKAYFGGFDDVAVRDMCRRIHDFRHESKMDDGAPILVYGYDVPDSQMPGLYTAADCYVGLSREGFGLSYAEAMSCGLPCIGPEVGGTREFMGEDNSFLVKYCGDEPIARETVSMFPSFEGLRWPRHSWEHLSEVMRKAAQNDGIRKEKAKKGMDFISKSLNYDAIGRRMISLLP